MFDLKPVQGSLLATGAPQVPTGLGTVTRIDLGHGAWIDWASDWLPGADEWLDLMARELPWQQAERPMYERMVEVPRLICSFDSPHDERIPLDLLRLRPVLEAAYGRSLPRIGANWYRDGNDSVAFHADKVPFPGDSLVVIVAVGERRPFHLRPRRDPDGRTLEGPTHRFAFGRGDLLVMGGTTQAYFQHGVPKQAGDRTRVSLMYRD
ncbi:MAG: alkylated DNA repair dioxygenase AlkB [Acidimicrobiales bacterium]|jgi:alkylated DNA repair dioxygenase AlkB